LLRVGFGATAAFVSVTLVAVLLSGTEPDRVGAEEYLPLAWVATIVIAAIFLIAGTVRVVRVRFGRTLPFVIGGVSVLASLVPWIAVFTGSPQLGGVIYRGLRVPQGIVPFWDLELPLKSIDCAAFGIDVYAVGNGCLDDPTIYGPGLLWLGAIPFAPLSARNTTVLGVVAIFVSSLFLVWLTRRTEGLGQAVLLLAAVGGPWLLLLERGNIDALVLWAAAIIVMLLARWNNLWSWSIAAMLIWILGTWKYYPFAMGLMLIPLLRVRRGWVVLALFSAATLAYVMATRGVLQSSAEANAAMADARDLAGIGRIPIVVRMVGMPPDEVGPLYGHALVYGIALAAMCWGVMVGRTWRRRPVFGAMLGVSGSAMYLVSVLFAGFGFGYKASFLLLGVPIVSRLLESQSVTRTSSALCILACAAVALVVMWNTVLATICGLCAAAFVLGLSLSILARMLRSARVTGSNLPCT